MRSKSLAPSSFCLLPRFVTEVGLHFRQFFGEQPSEQLRVTLRVFQFPLGRTRLHCQIWEREISAVAASSIRLNRARSRCCESRGQVLDTD